MGRNSPLFICFDAFSLLTVDGGEAHSAGLTAEPGRRLRAYAPPRYPCAVPRLGRRNEPYRAPFFSSRTVNPRAVRRLT